MDRIDIIPRDTVTIDIGGSFGIAQVTELHIQLCEARVETGNLILDISRVDRIDTAALQLLLCLQRDLAAEGKSVNWSRPSPSFVKAVNRLGMDNQFPFEHVDD